MWKSEQSVYRAESDLWERWRREGSSHPHLVLFTGKECSFCDRFERDEKEDAFRRAREVYKGLTTEDVVCTREGGSLQSSPDSNSPHNTNHPTDALFSTGRTTVPSILLLHKGKWDTFSTDAFQQHVEEEGKRLYEQAIGSLSGHDSLLDLLRLHGKEEVWWCFQRMVKKVISPFYEKYPHALKKDVWNASFVFFLVSKLDEEWETKRKGKGTEPKKKQEEPSRDEVSVWIGLCCVYIDSFLDDPSILSYRKRTVSKRIFSLLEGGTEEPPPEGEDAMRMLCIEEACRSFLKACAPWKEEMLPSLRKLLPLHHHPLTERTDDIESLRRYSLDLGGWTMLLLCTSTGPKKRRVAFLAGGLVQAWDDYADVEKDVSDGIRTFATESVRQGGEERLKEAMRKTLKEAMEGIVKDDNTLAPKEKEMVEFFFSTLFYTLTLPRKEVGSKGGLLREARKKFTAKEHAVLLPPLLRFYGRLVARIAISTITLCSSSSRSRTPP